MNKLYKAWINETGEKAPATVSIEPTIRCNMHCPMCDRTHKEDFRKHLEGEMSTELLLENIKILGEMGVKHILIIGGGEPLFRKDIVLLLKAIKQRGLICHLWTNGTMFTPENAPEILKNTDILTISLDSCYEDEHDKSRGIKGSYAHIMETLKMIKKYREDTLLLRFHSVISKYNINRLDDMVDFAIKHGGGELGGNIQYVRNMKGFVVKEIFSSWEYYISAEKQVKWHEVYTYTITKTDSYGNWIERKWTHTGKGGTKSGVDCRTITYY